MNQARPTDSAVSGPESGERASGTAAERVSGTDAASAYDQARFPDNYYNGLLIFLDRMRGRGLIRSYSGREIRFEFPFVTVVGAELGGARAGIELLREGDTVGFDVGWTSRGLRVTTIKPTPRVRRS